MSWLESLFRRKAQERELEAELRFHLEAQVADHVAGGMTPEEARRQAALALGGMEQAKERCRQVQPGRMMETMLQDLKFGLRSLRRSPGFTAAVLVILALGIGANTAIFSFVNGVLLKPPPFPEADRIVALTERQITGGWSGIAPRNYLDWAEQTSVFEHLAATKGSQVALSGIEMPVRLRCLQVSASYFAIFRIPAVLGRTFVVGEDEPGHDGVVVLTNRIWRTQFGADPAIVGRNLILDGKANTVIGVLAPGVFDRTENDLYRPLAFSPDERSRDFHLLIGYALVKPGVTLERVRLQMDLLAARMGHDFPATNRGWRVGVWPLAGTLVWNEIRYSLYVLMGAVVLVLLIACTNLANLMLARGARRDREVAIRAALGARRSRLVRQFLTESLLFAVAGGVLGLLVGYGFMAVLRQMPPGVKVPYTAEIALDGRVLGFTAALSLVTAVLFGLVPAMSSTRVDLNQAIKNGGPTAGSGRGFRRLRSALVITQVAAAFMLLSGAGLLIRSFLRLGQVDPGFNPAHLSTAFLPIDEQRFSTPAQLDLFLRQVVERTGAIPGVEAVALTSSPPIKWGWGYTMAVQIQGREELPRGRRPGCGFKMVTPSYLSTLGLTLQRGRWLTDRDVAGAPHAAVLSESMARKFFPDEDPIGRTILVPRIEVGKAAFGPDVPWEVVGVVREEKNFYFREEDLPGMYVPTAQSPATYQFVVVRSALGRVPLERAMRVALRSLSGGQVMDNLETLEEVKTESLAPDRRRSGLVGIFAAVALVLAGVGLYGVVAYSVVQRSRELGIRSALGATRAHLLSLVIRDGLTLTAVGLVIGLAGSFALAQIIASLLFQVEKFDPLTLLVVGGLLASASLLACWLPARRAMRADPMAALRCD